MDFSIRAAATAVMKPIIKRTRLSACGRAFAPGLALALLLAGCSTGAILADKLPEAAGGLPADTPARPVSASYQYPAVHDMPPPRATEPLNDAEQLRLEHELENDRDRLDSKAEALEKPAAGEKKPAKKPAKPKARDAKSGETSGAAAKP